MKKTTIWVACLGILSATTVLAQDKIVLKGKELFGDIQARHIGPALMSGRITDIEMHPTNNKIIFTATAGGGVWKSNDGGASFNSVFDDHIQSIGCVAIDPSKPDQNIWVGTGETWTRNSVSMGDGIYKSTDGGQNWKNMGLPKSDRIASIVIDPKNSDVVWVAVLGALWGDSDERGIYKTTDGGATWNKVLFVDNKTGCSDLIMDPKNSNIMYASFWEFRRTGWSFSSGGTKSALYKTTDGGKTWNKIHNGFPAGQLGRIAIAVAPSNSNILYSVLETEKAELNGLYRSEDAGATWKHLNSDFGLVVRPFYFSRIVVDPRNPDIVVKGGLNGSISRDGGKTFKNLGVMHSDIHDITFDNLDSNRIFCGTDGGVYRSWDGGNTMEMVSNLPVSQFYHVSIDDKEPFNVYGGLQDNGSWYGPSKSPGGVESRDWTRIGQGDGFRVIKHPTKNIIYSEMQGAENVWRYNTDTQELITIQPLAVKGDPKLRFNWNAPMEISQKQPDRFYMGSQFVHKSEDMGRTWTKISPDLTTKDPLKMDTTKSGGLSVDNSGAEQHCTIFTIAESPLNEKVIWAGTDDGNVQVTKDGGKTWTNVVANISGLPKNTWCYHIEASVFGEGTAYAVFEGHAKNDYTPYTYKTTDYGKTWKSIITPDVDGFVRNIQEDFKNENLLFLGTEKGLYITIDGGANWSHFTNNMPSVAVHFMDINKKTNSLVMATHGRGVIILDDITPLRQINQEVLAKDVHFFDLKPAIIEEQSSFGTTATELEFVGRNPSTSAQIIYYLKKRHTLGKMDIEIQDEKGNKIISLAPGKQKGINVVNWDFNMKNPKIAAAKTLSFAGFTAPRVQEGTYKVVLTKGKETYTHNLKVLNDPKSSISAADRLKQKETTRELFNKNEELAYTVYEIDETVKLLDQLIAKNKSFSKQGTKIKTDFESLKAKMVVTTGDGYVATAEPQLREKLGELYASVAGNFTAPSPSQLENKDAILQRFDTSMTEFKNLKAKNEATYLKQAKEQNIPFTLKTYAEFVAE
ncbi:WD40/YVTN/BNR-like repeat-containing protein [Flavobacterium sp. RSSB_23]|uniref:WD40/YVTN/BNR-like repeat-containing protein n=1 Tax=Flavobacterium sp. RSSB_23 TaxID=3447668 RepID=UPI003F30495E